MHTYKVNTGHEVALEREVARLKSEVDELEHAYNNMKQYADKLLDENVEVGERNEELKTNMALMSDEIAELNSQLKHMSKAYNEEYHETQVYKKAWREQREIVALRDDQVAMLERKLTKRVSEND
jgi:chromosome segregation ATPase